jgi:hypothetical protein
MVIGCASLSTSVRRCGALVAPGAAPFLRRRCASRGAAERTYGAPVNGERRPFFALRKPCFRREMGELRCEIRWFRREKGRFLAEIRGRNEESRRPEDAAHAIPATFPLPPDTPSGRRNRIGPAHRRTARIVARISRRRIARAGASWRRTGAAKNQGGPPTAHARPHLSLSPWRRTLAGLRSLVLRNRIRSSCGLKWNRYWDWTLARTFSPASKAKQQLEQSVALFTRGV